VLVVLIVGAIVLLLPKSKPAVPHRVLAAKAGAVPYAVHMPGGHITVQQSPAYQSTKWTSEYEGTSYSATQTPGTVELDQLQFPGGSGSPAQVSAALVQATQRLATMKLPQSADYFTTREVTQIDGHTALHTIETVPAGPSGPARTIEAYAVVVGNQVVTLSASAPPGEIPDAANSAFFGTLTVATGS
jgi:hypothetical protein